MRRLLGVTRVVRFVCVLGGGGGGGSASGQGFRVA